ncbi:MAG: BadF/BadG/BcrA/BcrD ATPase family protein [Verrucomicrobiota bacterium]
MQFSNSPFPPSAAAGCKIGVDGGGTKTECILLDLANNVVARLRVSGSNPSIVGPEMARRIVTDALIALRRQATAPVAHTLLCMAGARAFWKEFALGLEGFGQITVFDDARPVLELATNGVPGLVLHSGTGSFVAARAPDNTIHYAGGLGWRFGDPGSAYELGRRTLARGLLELQGWASTSRIAPMLCGHTNLGDAVAITRFFYDHAEPNKQIAALAPAVLRLTEEGDPTARQLVLESTGELLDLAMNVVAKLFPGFPLDALPTGLSGPILTHRVVVAALSSRCSLRFAPLDQPPIEGVRRLLMRG